jgi:LCP family protein required for cell wall assembly
MSEPLGPGWAAKKPPPSGDPEQPPRPKRFWWRFTLASVIIVAVSAAAIAISGLVYVDSIVAGIKPDKELSKVGRFISKVHGGEPQNILIIGSDKRANEDEDPGRSDTTILVRIDPEQGAISVLSIPRDLKVELPEGGIDKFNAAYAYGGPELTVRVVKELTGLPINHVVNVDFLGFVRAVYALGCVYTDVDRRYYHSNEGVPASEQYAEINVQPGYQLLCGKPALEYVRYRHTDTDIVRSARQQDFISAARQRVDVGDLVDDVVFGGGESGLIEIATKYTSSDIESKEEFLDLLKLFVAARGASLKEVHFPAELGLSYVEASPEAINEAVNQFLGVEAGSGSNENRQGAEEREQDASTKKNAKKGERKGGKGKRGKAKKKKEPPIVTSSSPGSDELAPAREAGEIEAKIAARRVHGPFPIYYPTRLPSGAHYVESNPYEKIVDPRIYRVTDGLGKDAERFEAYRMVLVAEMLDGTHYFGVQGIRGWPDPPILDNPSETKTIHGREYEIFADSGRIKLIAWHRGDNTYWVSNDLLQSLSNEQIVGMARSADVIVPKKKPKKGRNQR